MNRLLGTASWICCALVALSFGLFALDQLAGASHSQVSQLVAGTPGGATAQSPSGDVTGSTPPATQHGPGQPRRFIDGAARALTSPFTGIVSSDSVWISRGVPTLIALAAYGLGLGYLARYSAGRS